MFTMTIPEAASSDIRPWQLEEIIVLDILLASLNCIPDREMGLLL
jgi:hypothetical protein